MRAPLIIQAKDISKAYPRPGGVTSVLSSVSFSVPRGHIQGIIGRSGAGKSTLLRILAGLTKPDQGTVLIDGVDFGHMPVSQQRQMQSQLGFIFQGFNLLSQHTVIENIALPLVFQRIPKGQRWARAQELAHRVGLSGFDDRYPSQLSGGQRQRVAIARALATKPQILLCDEITSALDKETTYDILSLLQSLSHVDQLTVILITHDMDVVREVCDSVCVLEGGCVIEQGDIESILRAPQHPLTQSFVRHLFVQDLPQHWVEQLRTTPQKGGLAIIRMIFSGDVAGQPIISELIGKYGVVMNIIAGHLDHVRETAFGTLIVAVPTIQEEMTLSVLNQMYVGADVLGYIA